MGATWLTKEAIGTAVAVLVLMFAATLNGPVAAGLALGLITAYAILFRRQLTVRDLAAAAIAFVTGVAVALAVYLLAR